MCLCADLQASSAQSARRRSRRAARPGPASSQPGRATCTAVQPSCLMEMASAHWPGTLGAGSQAVLATFPHVSFCASYPQSVSLCACYFSAFQLSSTSVRGPDTAGRCMCASASTAFPDTCPAAHEPLQHPDCPQLTPGSHHWHKPCTRECRRRARGPRPPRSAAQGELPPGWKMIVRTLHKGPQAGTKYKVFQHVASGKSFGTLAAAQVRGSGRGGLGGVNAEQDVQV